jgi:hypothetical protein
MDPGRVRSTLLYRRLLLRLEDRLAMPKYLFIRLSIATLLLFSATDQARSDEISPDEVPAEEESVGWTPFQLALFNPVQIFEEDDDVKGARANVVYGNNRDVSGIDIGFIGRSESMTGFQVNAGYNGSETLDGIQIGSLNEVSYRVRGVQLGGVISYGGEVSGLQIAGAHNRAESITGVQIGGMVNETEELTGVQIGLINFNWSRPFPFQCLPFISIGFGGTGEDEGEYEE